MKRLAASILITVASASAFAQVNRPLPPSSVHNVRAVNSFVYPVVPSAADIVSLTMQTARSMCPDGQVLSGGSCVSTSAFGGVPTVAKLIETFAGRSSTSTWNQYSSSVQIWIDGTNVCTYTAGLGGAFCVGKYGPFSATNGYYELQVSPLGIVASRAGYSDSSPAYVTSWDSSQLTLGQGPSTMEYWGQGSSP